MARDYRHYHIKTVIGPNTAACMKIVSAYYRRLVDEGASSSGGRRAESALAVERP
jgi:hypothetical protein